MSVFDTASGRLMGWRAEDDSHCECCDRYSMYDSVPTCSDCARCKPCLDSGESYYDWKTHQEKKRPVPPLSLGLGNTPSTEKRNETMESNSTLIHDDLKPEQIDEYAKGVSRIVGRNGCWPHEPSARERVVGRSETRFL